jgi:2-polyprenyl-6-methoxyphenol hydroxylase-like FAD-dependent oxidoreductase
MMSDQAKRIGIFVEYGKRAVEYYEDAAGQKAGVVLENEERIEADLIIAADGIGSKSSIITMGKEVRARSSGSSIYGGTIPIEVVQADPLMSERFSGVENGKAVVELWQGYVIPFSGEN